MGIRILCCILTLACLLPVAGAAEKEISIAVMEFESKGGIQPQQMEALSDMLANEIRAMGNYRVVGKQDIKAILQVEEQKMLLGCSNDSCIAEIGGALGVNWMVVGNISKFGKTYLLNLKMLDVAAITVIAGLSRKVKGGEDMLIDALSAAAKEMITKARKTLKTTAKPPVDKPPPDDNVADKPDPDHGHGSTGDTGDSGGTGDSGTGVADGATGGDVETAAPAPKGKYNLWGHVTFWSGVGLTVIGVGGVIGAWINSEIYYDEEENTGARLDALDANSASTALAVVGLGAGLALVTTGIILWVLDKPADEAEAPPAVGIGTTPDGQGVFLGVGGRW